MAMRIRILRQTSISGRPARVGDVLEATPADARLLLAMGRAERAPDPDPVVITAPEAAKPRSRKSTPRQTDGRS
jgi:hypothetical protein